MARTCDIDGCPLNASRRVDNGEEAGHVCEWHSHLAVHHPEADVGPDDVGPLPQAG